MVSTGIQLLKSLKHLVCPIRNRWFIKGLSKQASYRTVFIFSGSKLIGFGRAISDGEYQAAFYDISVSPSFQGQGVGKTIVSALKDGLSNCNIIFYSTPGMEGFYKKQGFHSLSTGMGLFSSIEANKKLTY